jgi:4-oxalocrotonate tautomerase family enzyme
MPFVNVRTLKGALDPDQKRELQERLTDVLVAVEGGGNPVFRQFVWVMIEEEDASHWMIGGVVPSLEQLRALRQAR